MHPLFVGIKKIKTITNTFNTELDLEARIGGSTIPVPLFLRQVQINLTWFLGSDSPKPFFFHLKCGPTTPDGVALKDSSSLSDLLFYFNTNN